MKLLKPWAGNKKGFTLFEMLLAISILIILLAITLPISLNFYNIYQFDSEVGTLISLLEKARSSALANRNESAHGFYFSSTTFVIFQGSSYSSRAAALDKTFSRTGNVYLSGPSELVFSALSGQTSSSTYNLSNGPRSENVYVNSEGTIIY
ncbi:MAG: prepilin-type N-terminal cleavage/methylation domain-containing protein [bacterium]|nr:prepilin-type N-terminal cleavage/methylation domain-containing protein [bacterium]